MISGALFWQIGNCTSCAQLPIVARNKSIITKNDLITSYITIVNDFNECIITNSEEYIIKDVINFVNPTYTFLSYY